MPTQQGRADMSAAIDAKAVRDRMRGFASAAKRELVVLAVCAVAFAVLLPLASEANPEYEKAQSFLDRMEIASASLRNGVMQPGDVDTAYPGIAAGTVGLADAGRATIVVGTYGDRCLVIHWSDPGVSDPKAGVLDPALPCAPSEDVLATLPTPPLVEVFPGTVPPLDATLLLTRGAPHHEPSTVFPADRTAPWFLPAAALLIAVMLWEAAGLVIVLLSRRHPRPRPGAP